MGKNFFSDLVSESDYLGYSPYIKAFEYLIDNSNELISLPIVFGLHGEWGTGKSTFMHLMKKIIDSKNYENGNKKYISFNINPWEYDNERNFIAVFIAKLYGQVNDLIKDESQNTVNLLKALVKPLKISFKNIANIEYDFSKLNFNEQKSEIDKVVSENFLLSKTIEDILENPVFDELKIVVFIDDLDRCSIDKVMEVIESIKLVLNSKNCIFFIGCDRNYLENAISVRYEKFFARNLNINKNKILKSFASEYLEKIIQVPFYIPSLDESSIDTYIECILNGKVESEDNQVVNDKSMFNEFKDKLNKNLLIKLVTSIGVNPRKIRRILNLLFLSFLFIKFKLEDSRSDDIDLDILSILNIIRDYDHDYYKQYLSSDILCKEIFESYYNYYKNMKKNSDNISESELPTFMQVEEINNCFKEFFKELNIKTENEFKDKLKHITIYISVSNIITSENYNSNIPEYRSDTATNKNISYFIRKLENNEQAQKLVTWFFTHIYDKEKFALGINQNMHLYRRYENGDFDVVRCFIFRIEYDSYTHSVTIRFERGKYQCCIEKYEQFMNKFKLFDKARKLIEIKKNTTDEDLLKIQDILKILIEESTQLKNNIVREVATDGEN